MSKDRLPRLPLFFASDPPNPLIVQVQGRVVESRIGNVVVKQFRDAPQQCADPRGELVCDDEPGLQNDDDLCERLDRIEAKLALLVEQRSVKDWYTTREAAKILGKAEFTVREWCRLDRVKAKKRACGRGQTQEWIISHDELLRVQNEGLLPLAKY